MDFVTENKEIRIVEDDSVIIKYQTIENDTVNRDEIASIEEAIELLEKEVAEKNARIDELKAKVEFAKKIIALADEKKAMEEATAEETTIASE